MNRRLVLDTNVWLDWLVFDDAGVAPLKFAQETGAAEVLIDAACEHELSRVLAYPRRTTPLDPAGQAECLTRCRQIAQAFTRGTGIGAARQPCALPVCKDPDDQKFLELARDCGAHFLVTKDRALLVLAQRTHTPLTFRIVTPAQCATALQSP